MFNMLRVALASVAVARIKQRVDNMVVHIILLTATGIIGLAGAGFLLAAAWSALAAELSPVGASLVIGGALVALAVFVYVYALLRQSRAQKAITRKVAPAMPTAAVAGLPDVNLASVLLVAGMGYVAGRMLVKR